MNILPHENSAMFDLLIDTGRGAWVPMSKTSLGALLQKFDNAYPNFTEGTRQELIERWRAGEMIQLERPVVTEAQTGRSRGARNAA